ncbi:pilus assembly protein PilM [Candidatus Woesebacteria bacterium]|nr:pilus assembly protein PilM [Candidatus Woesebacteria bacterium]
MAVNLLSLNINNLHTRMGHLRLTKKGVELLSLGVENTTNEFFSNINEVTAKQQSDVIKELYTNLNIKAHEVSVIIPDSMTYSQILIMPNLKEEELVKSIRLQADEFIPLPIDEVYIDIEVISQLEDNKLLVLIVASQKKFVDHISRTLEIIGLEPHSLENELSSLGRFVSEVFKPSKEPSIIINFGYEGSSIYLVNPALPHFQLTRTTNIGLEIIARDIKINFGWNDEQTFDALKKIGFSSSGSVNLYSLVYPVFNELLVEIEKTLLQARNKHNVSVKNIYMFNYDNYIGSIHSVIQTKTSLPTAPFPLQSFVIKNPITKAFNDSLSSFVSVIAGHIR